MRKMWMILMILAAGVMVWPAAAQGGNPTTAYQLNMRTGPGTTYDTVTILPGGTTGKYLHARLANSSARYLRV